MGHETAKKPPPPARAYSYIRLSSKRQANHDDRTRYRDGFRRQVEMREDYLRENPHLTLDDTLKLHDIGVSGYTGANAARGGPGKLAAFQKAVDDGLVPKGSYLLMESLDRFTRTQVTTAQMMLLALVNAGIIVVSLTDRMVYRNEPDDQASQANFMFSVMTLMRGHEESRMKSIRLQKTWEEKRRSIGTRKLTRRVPGWLTLVDDKFVENPKRVAVVKRIMGWLADGHGRDRIAEFLNKDPDKDTHCWGTGHQWHGGTVQKVTDNRALIGEFQPHKLAFEEVNGVRVSRRVPVGEPVLDYYPRVIDEELWARARAVADKRRMGKAPNAGGRQGTVISNLFGMVATCADCGKLMNYRDRGPRSTPVLRCSGERSGNCTNTYRIPYDDNQNAILSWLVTLDLSGGSKGEAARLDDLLRTKVAMRAELKERGSAIVRKFREFMEYADEPLREIAAEQARLDREIVDISATLTALKATNALDERVEAVGELIRLTRNRAAATTEPEIKAADEESFMGRTRMRQIIRDTFIAMRCHPDGRIEIDTIDGGRHLFRDGYWWNEEYKGWIPWAGSMFGMGYRATRAELRRRGAWLAEAEAAHPPMYWQDVERAKRTGAG